MNRELKGLALGGALSMLFGCAHPKEVEHPKAEPAAEAKPQPAAERPAEPAAPATTTAATSDTPKDDALYFDYDSATLTSAATERLQEVAGTLKKKKAEKLRIEGNCDARGTAEHNLALGQQR